MSNRAKVLTKSGQLFRSLEKCVYVPVYEGRVLIDRQSLMFWMNVRLHTKASLMRATGISENGFIPVFNQGACSIKTANKLCEALGIHPEQLLRIERFEHLLKRGHKMYKRLLAKGERKDGRIKLDK